MDSQADRGGGNAAVGRSLSQQRVQPRLTRNGGFIENAQQLQADHQYPRSVGHR